MTPRRLLCSLVRVCLILTLFGAAWAEAADFPPISAEERSLTAVPCVATQAVSTGTSCVTDVPLTVSSDIGQGGHGTSGVPCPPVCVSGYALRGYGRDEEAGEHDRDAEPPSALSL